MRTANPALNENLFEQHHAAPDTANVMTVQGTINKTAVLLALLFAAAGWTWYLALPGGIPDPKAAMPWLIGGLVAGLVLALVTIFKPRAAPYTAPIYAICEGLFLGALSALVQSRVNMEGIVVQAVGLTFGTLFTMLVLYSMRIIRVTEKFRAGLLAATGAVLLVYVATWVLGFFGVGIPFIHGSGTIGILFSVVVVVIAALNLVLDFDLIERGAQQGAPKYMEWYGGFALLVTLVWLYLEILRLLAKLRQR